MKLIEELTLLNIIFLALAILGIVLAIFFFIKSRKEKAPVYKTKTTQLVKNNLSSIEKLQILYDGETLQNLYLTKISIWNSGRETINKSDFVVRDPLIIDCQGDGIIYDFKIEYADERNAVSVTKIDSKNLKIDFDYLDKNQGLLLSVFHSTDSSNLILKGSFKGARKIEVGYGKELISSTFFNSKPVKFSEGLINNKYKIIGFLAFMIFLPIYMITTIIMSPIFYAEKLFDKYYNNPPKEFKLE